MWKWREGVDKEITKTDTDGTKNSQKINVTNISISVIMWLNFFSLYLIKVWLYCKEKL